MSTSFLGIIDITPTLGNINAPDVIKIAGGHISQ